MKAPRHTLLLSIRPVYAKAILSGRKRVELRRTRPRVEEGTSVLIYASSPRCALLGGATVAKVEAGAPSALWDDVRHDADVTRRVFREYFQGAASAYAIWLRDAWTYLQPIGLATMRHRLPGFTPPQSYRYLQASAAQLLSALSE